MEKVYLSGPITGTKDYIERFWAAEEKISKAGGWAVNPVTLINEIEVKSKKKLSWAECLRYCFDAIEECDSIYMLAGWENSKGAALEFKYAQALNKKFMFEESSDLKEEVCQG